MTFGGHIVYFGPEQHELHPSRARVQIMLRGTQINYMPDKSQSLDKAKLLFKSEF